MQKTKTQLLRWPAVLLALVVVLALGGKLVHSYLVDQNEQLVHSVAQTLLPALLANDTQQLGEVLKSLEAYPGIERIELISSEGSTIASLSRVGDQLGPIANEFALAAADNEADQLQVAAPITYDSLILANLHIAVNLWPAYMRIMSWLGALLILPSVLYVIIKQMRIKVRFERVNVFSQGDCETGPFDLQEVMKEAFEEAQISIEYQPIKRLSDGGLYGFELIVCWHHPSGQTLHLSPAEFIELTKKWGMFFSVDHWVLQTACEQAGKWQLTHGPLVMSFNLTHDQLTSKDFALTVQQICKNARYPTQLIEFEIAESLLAKQANPRQIVDDFVSQGLNLTIDQFGLSRESEELWTNLAVQKIKFNPKLIANFEQDEQIQKLVESIAHKAQANDIVLMADGVNKPEYFKLLDSLNCAYVQGKAVGLPMSAQLFEAQLATTDKHELYPLKTQSAGVNI